MISAADAWAGQGFGPGGDDPVEELLAGLGAAARLFGELEDALREPEPDRAGAGHRRARSGS